LVIASVAVVSLTSACASTGGVPRPFPTPADRTGAATAEPTPLSSPDTPADASNLSPIVETALGLQGTRYRYGGADPGGFDCSGFTQYVFGRHAIWLPREVRDQFSSGEPVRSADLRPGDLLFFSTTAPGPTHVAIALGRDDFVHAPNSTGVVRIERLTSTYWSRRFIGARRVE
jgi:cell wall-associated NlpC family hydrolase